MKALGECFLMVVFTLLLNRVHDFENFMFKSQQHLLLVPSLMRVQHRAPEWSSIVLWAGPGKDPVILLSLIAVNC